MKKLLINKIINHFHNNLNCLVIESIYELGAGPIAPTVIEPNATYHIYQIYLS
jgi:hypothetical protein